MLTLSGYSSIATQGIDGTPNLECRLGRDRPLTLAPSNNACCLKTGLYSTCTSTTIHTCRVINSPPTHAAKFSLAGGV